MRSELAVLSLVLAASCASAPVAQKSAAPAEPDLGPLPLSLQPHFACGPDSLKIYQEEKIQ
jgi:hypothetical protein